MGPWRVCLTVNFFRGQMEMEMNRRLRSRGTSEFIYTPSPNPDVRVLQAPLQEQKEATWWGWEGP